MAWPHLPDLDKPKMTDSEQKRWDAMPERTRMDVERWTAYNKRNTETDLQLEDANYPLGDFFQSRNDPW
jgi:hypothetical protein